MADVKDLSDVDGVVAMERERGRGKKEEEKRDFDGARSRLPMTMVFCRRPSFPSKTTQHKHRNRTGGDVVTPGGKSYASD